MAKDQGIVQTAMRRRTPIRTPASGSAARAADEERRPRVGPFQFLREVRAEARKISWTSWKETWITSVMVGIMVLLAAGFFWVINSVISLAITQILKLASGG